MSTLLWAAGIYNLILGALAVAAPGSLFRWAGVAEPNYPEITQVLGAFVALLGLCFLLSSADPIRHWRFVLLGLAGKLAMAAGIALMVWRQHLPTSALWFGALDDLIWIAPLAWILHNAHESLLNHRRTIAPEVVRMALRKRTQHEVTLDELSRLSPILLVFLRHTGCTFCREALADLAVQRARIEKSGTRIVLIHMSSEEQGRKLFAKHGLGDVPRVSDPERSLYRAFGLRRGSLLDLFGPRVWWRGFEAGILGRHGIGKLAGDGFQMPGVFLVYHGEILRSYRHESASDRPKYLALVTGASYSRPEVEG